MKNTKAPAIGGILCLAGWAFIPRIPVLFSTHSTNGQIVLDGAQAHALCNSTLGELGQSMSATVAQTCSGVNNFYFGMMMLGIVGVVLVVLAVLFAWQNSRPAPAGAE